MLDHCFVGRLTRAILVVFAVGLATAASAAEDYIDLQRPLAKVGETEIKLGHVLALVAILPQSQRDLPPEQLFFGALNRLVRQEALAQSMTEVPLLTQMQLENERRSLLTSHTIEALSHEINVDPDEVKAAYLAKYDNASVKREFRAAHILVDSEEKAKMLADELAAGADFDALARRHSIGPSGPNGGNLGWFGPGRMVAPFEAAVRDLGVGEISPPVETQFGWHVIILRETRIPNLPSFEDVRAQLEQQLWQEAYDTRLAALIDAVPAEPLDLSGIDPEAMLKPAMMPKPEMVPK